MSWFYLAKIMVEFLSRLEPHFIFTLHYWYTFHIIIKVSRTHRVKRKLMDFESGKKKETELYSEFCGGPIHYSVSGKNLPVEFAEELM